MNTGSTDCPPQINIAFFENEEHLFVVKNIYLQQQKALENIRQATKILDECTEISPIVLDKFQNYSKQVQRIRQTIENIFMRIQQLKTNVQTYAMENNIPLKNKGDNKDDDDDTTTLSSLSSIGVSGVVSDNLQTDIKSQSSNPQ
ncbi:hypothetical protein RFI_13594 [Reticulomyxa filosa]|uniref:Uncharacterized protein n=1 Tax=Reticulomyxa filosa TaxID=46433 RepID=X6NCT9_RETFI|nr:hypothetical protein RFI_13594 [Reticulomyxa filosa]|eukprot:ETO23584.1 hypothetical protein RFI_13594 [Reticulomyxa filosa]